MTKLEIAGKIPAKSSNRQVYLNKKTGKRFYASSDAYQDFEDDFLWQVKSKKCVQLPVNKKGRLSVTLIVYDTSRRQDIDSFPKSLLDCLQKAQAIVNDNKVDELIVLRAVDKENPRCFIKVEELSQNVIINRFNDYLRRLKGVDDESKI